MTKFTNHYYRNALEVLLERKEVITLTGEEQKLLDVLEHRSERDVIRFLQDNPSFNFMIVSLQR